VSVCVCVNLWMCVCACVSVCVCVCKWLHVCQCVPQPSIRKPLHTAHTHTHTHVHTRTCVISLLPARALSLSLFLPYTLTITHMHTNTFTHIHTLITETEIASQNMTRNSSGTHNLSLPHIHTYTCLLARTIEHEVQQITGLDAAEEEAAINANSYRICHAQVRGRVCIHTHIHTSTCVRR